MTEETKSLVLSLKKWLEENVKEEYQTEVILKARKLIEGEKIATGSSDGKIKVQLIKILYNNFGVKLPEIIVSEFETEPEWWALSSSEKKFNAIKLLLGEMKR